MSSNRLKSRSKRYDFAHYSFVLVQHNECRGNGLAPNVRLRA